MLDTDSLGVSEVALEHSYSSKIQSINKHPSFRSRENIMLRTNLRYLLIRGSQMPPTHARVCSKVEYDIDSEPA